MKQNELVLNIWKEIITSLFSTPRKSLIHNQKAIHKISSLEKFYYEQYKKYMNQDLSQTRIFKHLTTKIPSRMHVIFISIVFKLTVDELNDMLFKLRMVQLNHSVEDILLKYALENSDVVTYFMVNDTNLDMNLIIKQNSSHFIQYINKYKEEIVNYENRKNEVLNYIQKTKDNYYETCNLTEFIINNLLPYDRFNRNRIRMNIYNFIHKENELFTNRNYFVVYCIGLGLNPYEINYLLSQLHMTPLNVYPEERFIYDFLLEALKHNPFIFTNEFEINLDTIEKNEIYCIGEEITHCIDSFQNDRCDIEKYICRMYM